MLWGRSIIEEQTKIRPVIRRIDALKFCDGFGHYMALNCTNPSTTLHMDKECWPFTSQQAVQSKMTDFFQKMIELPNYSSCWFKT
jgi:hypothetical protein